jgi:sugar/nucleoside kinase (ribokinase family)
VVLKKGEHGVLLFSKDFVFGIPAYPSDRVVDPTGAGDSFGGGFLGYLDKIQSYDEKDIRIAAVFGSVIASFVIEDFGIEPFRKLSKFDVDARFFEFQKLVAF